MNDSSEQPVRWRRRRRARRAGARAGAGAAGDARAPVVPEGWTDLDPRAVDTVRVLAMDAVEKAGNGHPGTAMSLAPAAYLLFQRLMRHDPTDPTGSGRDRFVLSAGHSSLTLYIQLYLSGYGLELDDLKALRHLGLADPGPPRARAHRRRRDHHRPARPGRRQRGRHGDGRPPRARPVRPGRRAGREPVRPPRSTCIASDGDIEEGISSEASARSPATSSSATSSLIYDDNHISIEDDTNDRAQPRTSPRATRRTAGTSRRSTGAGRTGRTTRTSRRWTPRSRRPRRRPTGRRSSRCARSSAGRRRTRRTPARPTARRSAPTRSPRPRRSSASTRTRPSTSTRRGARARPRGRRPRPRRARRVDRRVRRLGGGQPGARGSCSTGCAPARCPTAGTDALPTFAADAKGMATRKASGEVLNAIAPVLPELWGGSADLAESNNTTMEGEPSFIPAEHQTKEFPGGPYGRTLHFGIREHAHGLDPERHRAARRHPRRTAARSWSSATTCARPVRLAALMKLPVIYVWTHDSIGLGEDGPTHQPIEHLAALRAIPGLDVVRPADANETAVGLADDPGAHRPAGRRSCLTRQNLPTFDRTGCTAAPTARPQGRLRPGRGRRRPARGDPDRAPAPRCSSPSQARERLEAEGIADPGRVDAVRGVVRRAGRRLPAVRCCRPASRPGSASRPAIAHGLARPRRRRRRDRQHRALRRERAVHRRCSSSSASPPTGWWPRPTPASSGSARSRAPPPATDGDHDDVGALTMSDRRCAELSAAGRRDLARRPRPASGCAPATWPS